MELPETMLVPARKPRLNYAEERATIVAQQNFPLAIATGLAAALIGAALWAVLVAITKMELGLSAIAVGALVGYSIKKTGRGLELKFGILGALCAILGWGLGILCGDIAFVAHQTAQPFLALAKSLTPHQMVGLVTSMFNYLDIVFFAVAVYEAYKLSFKFVDVS